MFGCAGYVSDDEDVMKSFILVSIRIVAAAMHLLTPGTLTVTHAGLSPVVPYFMTANDVRAIVSTVPS